MPIFLLLGCLVPQIQAQLNLDQYSYSTSRVEVTDLFFLDSTHGWIAVRQHDSGRFHLFRTQNGGNSWTSCKAPHGIFRLFFVNPSVGWALKPVPNAGLSESSAYIILRTDTGGRTWRPLLSESVAQANRDGFRVSFLAFSDTQNGWFVGAGPHGIAIVFHTSDGGETIQRLVQPHVSIKNPFGVLTQDHAVWVYGHGFAMNSQDGGKTWNSLDPREFGTTPDLFWISSGFFWKNGRGWLVGSTSTGVVLGTGDSGGHWDVQLDTGHPNHIDAISSWDEKNACVVAHPTYLFCTIDGGSTWMKRESLPLPSKRQANFFTRLVMLESGRGWALRGGGYLYETTDGGNTWHELDLLKQRKKP